jgi:hypothetical protein
VESLQADPSPEQVPLKLRARFRELEKAIEETRQLLARLRELGAQEKAPPAGTQARPADEARGGKDVTSRLVVARV